MERRGTNRDIPGIIPSVPPGRDRDIPLKGCPMSPPPPLVFCFPPPITRRDWGFATPDGIARVDFGEASSVVGRAAHLVSLPSSLV